MRGNAERRSRLRLAVLTIGCAVVVGLATGAGSPAGAATMRWPGSRSAPSVIAPLSGRADAEMLIALRGRSEAQEARFAAAVSTPGNPLYRRYLTVAQFARRFGASASRIAVVRRYLHGHGLAVTVNASHLTILVRGSVEQFTRALRVSSELALVRAAGASAPTGITLPAPLSAAVLALGQLHILRVHPAQEGRLGGAPVARTAATSEPRPCASAVHYAQASDSSGVYAAHDGPELAQAYGFDGLYATGDTGAGQTIAVIEKHNPVASDIATFQRCYGTDTSITDIPVEGGATATNSTGEAQLDIENLIEMAPSANIEVYTTTSVPEALAQAASDDTAHAISISYGGCSQSATTFEQAAEEAATQGQAIFVSAGDQGSAGCSPFTSVGVETDAADPYVTGVGGTTLYSVVNGKNRSYRGKTAPVEAVWNDGDSSSGPSGVIGTGGGVSTLFAMPSYQQDAAATLGVINQYSGSGNCGSQYCREVPDVSADADPTTGYAIYYQGEWQTWGGTSGSAPFWAAFDALANAQPACGGQNIGFLNPALYSLASTDYADDFSAVDHASPESGAADNDANGGANGLYPIGPGYDLATGLGVMRATNLARGLCGVGPATVTVSSPGAQNISTGEPVEIPISATDSASAPLTYTASGLPAGLSIDQNTGTLTGFARSAGTSQVTVTAADADGTQGSTSFAITATAPDFPTVTSATVRIVDGQPVLRISAAAGVGSEGISRIEIAVPSAFRLSVRRGGLSVRTPGFGGRYRRSESSSELTVRPEVARPTVIVSLRAPGIAISRSLARRIAAGEVTRVRIEVLVTEVGGRSLRLRTIHA